MRKKSDITALRCLRETQEWNTCFGPRNSKIVSQNSRLSTIPTSNMRKGVIDMTIEEKYLEHHQKSVNSKHFRYLFTYLENKPENVLNISRDTSNMASDTQHS